jgi:hypothetical protein
MRRVSIEVLCSPCYHEDGETETPAEGIVLAIGWSGPKVLDLCQEHKADANLETLTGWLHEYGMDLDEVESDDPMLDPDLVCTVPDCERHTKPFVSKGGRNNHLSRMHGVPREEWPA